MFACRASSAGQDSNGRRRSRTPSPCGLASVSSGARSQDRFIFQQRREEESNLNPFGSNRFPGGLPSTQQSLSNLTPFLNCVFFVHALEPLKQLVASSPLLKTRVTKPRTPQQKLQDAERAKRYRERNPEKARAATRNYMRNSRQDGAGGKIYFLQVPSGPIKIGFTTKKPMGRMLELQAGNHETLTLLHWMPGTLEMERDLHRRFLHLLLRSEWFQPGPDLLEFIRLTILGPTIV